MEEESVKNVQSITYKLYVMHTMINFESYNQCHDIYCYTCGLLLSSFTSGLPATMSSFSIMEEQSHNREPIVNVVQRSKRNAS